ncbi:MAG: formylglycine-generating enzyme family protein, partial [Planctomycetia bacterium]
RGFWLADTACTQELWEAVMGSNPSFFKGEKRMLRPVEQVSFEDVSEFLGKLNQLVPHGMLTLPTEAQWEYACRAGTTTPFSFGDTMTTDQVNFDGNHPYGNSPKGVYRKETVEVQSLPANRWGLHQMHGNVWEWCSDWYAEYLSQPQVDPTGPATGSYRVFRGGSWCDVARLVRSACRHWFGPGARSSSLGFRLLSSASPDRNQPPNK